MIHANGPDRLQTTLVPISNEFKLVTNQGTLPESIGGLLQALRDEAMARIPEGKAGERARLEVTIREIDLVLAEMREPFWRDRPLWPRAVRIIARMIEDGLL